MMKKYGVSTPFDKGFQRGLSGLDSSPDPSIETRQDYIAYMEGVAQGHLARKERQENKDKK